MANPKTFKSDFERGWHAGLDAVDIEVKRHIDNGTRVGELIDALKPLRKHNPFPSGEKGERIPSGDLEDAAAAILRIDGDRDWSNKSDMTVEMTLSIAKLLRNIAASPPPAKEDGIEIVREAREHVALRLDGMERIGATAEAKRSARSLLQRMDAALAQEGTP